MFTFILAFILLPLVLCTIYAIVESIKKKLFCRAAGVYVLLILLYSPVLPVFSIFYSAMELFWGKDKQADLTDIKQFKMFEHFGES